MPELLHPGVYTFEVSSGVRPIEGVSTSTAAFVGVADKGPIPGGEPLPDGRVARPDMVTSLTEYFRRYGGFRKDSFLTYAVRAFYENGGRRAYIVRVVPTQNPQSPDPAFKAPKAAALAFGTGNQLSVVALNEGVWGNRTWVKIEDSSDGDKVNHFKLSVFYGGTEDDRRPALVEAYDNLDIRSTEPTFVASVINGRSEFIVVKNTATIARPANKFVTNASGEVTNADAKLKDGSDGAGRIDYIGAAAPDNTRLGRGLHALDKVTDVNMIAIPGQGSPDIVGKGVEYCKNQRALQDCFFIGDVGEVPGGVEAARVVGANTNVATIADAVKYSQTDFKAKAAGDYGAVYFPWVRSTDPIGVGPNPHILLPPSGFLAGIYARTDNTRGVFKAPAGTEAGVAGALDVATPVSDTEQDRLNPIGVNVVRTVPTAGIVVWGTRTIGSNAEWRYIPVRRMAIFLRVSIYYGIQWAVFEPNDEDLWAALRLNIRAFMLTQFRAGAFQGSSPDAAFFVRCDATTTTQQDIDNGVVNILVGFAPLKPAEFVVLKLSQKVSQPEA